MNKVLSTAEIASTWAETGKRKGNLPLGKMFFLAILAGMFIGFGCVSFLTMTANYAGETAIFGKLVGAASFSIGLMLVIFFGAELFTGNCLMPIAVLEKKITVKQLIRNWLVVYGGNAVGSYIFAYILFLSGLFAGDAMKENIIKVAQAKVSMGFTAAVMRGILCNVLVVFALWFQSASPDMGGKVLAIIFPIMIFVFCGYEHSIANMFFLPMGQLMGAEVSTISAWMNNIIPVTIGNIIGGAGVAVGMWWVNLKGNKL